MRPFPTTLAALGALALSACPPPQAAPAPSPNATSRPAAAVASSSEPASDPAPAEPPPAEQPLTEELRKPLRDPSLATATAPETFRARFDTTEGAFVVEVKRAWAPLGADRFYNLVRCGYYDGCSFFRVIDGFMAQFGIHGDPQINQGWSSASFADEPVRQSNTRGMVTFARTAAPNSRTTQLFINFSDNSNLDGMGFAPFGKVVEGMEVVDRLHAGYGEGAPRGRGPSQQLIQMQGNAYLEEHFPALDSIRTVRLLQE